MTKQEAIEYIEQSNAEYFTVTKFKQYQCDLCKENYNHVCEFTISAKHVNGTTTEGIKLNTNGKTRVTKRICTNCFIKLFPNEVIK